MRTTKSRGILWHWCDGRRRRRRSDEILHHHTYRPILYFDSEDLRVGLTRISVLFGQGIRGEEWEYFSIYLFHHRMKDKVIPMLQHRHPHVFDIEEELSRIHHCPNPIISARLIVEQKDTWILLSMLIVLNTRKKKTR